MAVDAPTTAIGYVNQSYGSSTNSWWMYDGETTPELRWPQSVEVYDAMRTQDAQVGSVLEAVVRPILRTPWRVNPAGARKEVVEFVADDLGLPVVGENPDPPPRTKDRFSWLEHLELALLMLPFGHIYFEQIYRPDDDGDRAHLGKLEPRMPRTIDKIDVARDGGLISITQCGTLDYGMQKPIPVNRLVAYIYKREGGNWLGRSILRQAYKNWLIKDRLLRVQAQTIERNGMGIPVSTDAENATPAQHDAGLAMAKALRAGEAAGIALPFGATLTLMGVSGTLPDAQPAIDYHDNQIARAVLAHFLNLGQQSGTGSYALGVTFADFFTASLQTLAQQIADVATQHIVEDLVDKNWGPGEPAPKITFDEIGSRQAATAQSIVALMGAGALTPDERLEESLRQQYGLPPLDPETARGENALNIPGSPAAEAGPATEAGGTPPPPSDQEWVAASSDADPKVGSGGERDDDVDLTAALIQALAEFTGEIHAAAGGVNNNPLFNAKHPRGPGGKFRDVVNKIMNALVAYSKGNGPDDPLPPSLFSRAHLKAAADHRGLTVRPRATRDEIRDLLLGEVGEKARARRAAPKPTAKFTLQHPPHAGKDVAVYRNKAGDVGLFEETDAGRRRANPLERFDSLDELHSWADKQGETLLADWAEGERVGKVPAKKAAPDAKRAPAKKATPVQDAEASPPVKKKAAPRKATEAPAKKAPRAARPQVGDELVWTGKQSGDEPRRGRITKANSNSVHVDWGTGRLERIPLADLRNDDELTLEPAVAGDATPPKPNRGQVALFADTHIDDLDLLERQQVDRMGDADQETYWTRRAGGQDHAAAVGGLATVAGPLRPAKKATPAKRATLGEPDPFLARLRDMDSRAEAEAELAKLSAADLRTLHNHMGGLGSAHSVSKPDLVERLASMWPELNVYEDLRKPGRKAVTPKAPNPDGLDAMDESALRKYAPEWEINPAGKSADQLRADLRAKGAASPAVMRERAGAEGTAPIRIPTVQPIPTAADEAPGSRVSQAQDQIRTAVDRILQRDGREPGAWISLTDVRRELSSGPGTREVEVENKIRAAYNDLPKGAGIWVGLADLREHPLLRDLPRDEVDAALLRGARHGMPIEPVDNRRGMSQRDRDAALLIGGDPTLSREMISFHPPGGGSRLAGEQRRAPLLPTQDFTREEVDKALTLINRDPNVRVIPEANQKALTQGDWDASVMIGNESRHAISITPAADAPAPPKAAPAKKAAPRTKLTPEQAAFNVRIRRGQKAGLNEAEVQDFADSGLTLREWRRQRGGAAPKADGGAPPSITPPEGGLTPAAREVVGVRELPGGITSKVEELTYSDGTRKVSKDYLATRQGDEAGRRLAAKIFTDSEDLAADVLQVVGVQRPDVERIGDHTILMTFVEGRQGGETGILKAPAAIVRSDEGRRLGLADALMGHRDRGGGNWMVTPDGHLVAIDNGGAFLGSGRAAAGNPFTSYIMGQHEESPWKSSIELPAGVDLAEVRRGLHALRPKFDRLGRQAYFEAMMARLDEIESRTVRTPNRRGR